MSEVDELKARLAKNLTRIGNMVGEMKEGSPSQDLGWLMAVLVPLLSLLEKYNESIVTLSQKVETLNQPQREQGQKVAALETKMQGKISAAEAKAKAEAEAKAGAEAKVMAFANGDDVLVLEEESPYVGQIGRVVKSTAKSVKVTFPESENPDTPLTLRVEAVKQVVPDDDAAVAEAKAKAGTGGLSGGSAKKRKLKRSKGQRRKSKRRMSRRRSRSRN